MTFHSAWFLGGAKGPAWPYLNLITIGTYGPFGEDFLIDLSTARSVFRSVRLVSILESLIASVRPLLGPEGFACFRRADGEFITSIFTMIIGTPVVRLHFVNGARLERSLECQRRGGEDRCQFKDTLFAARVPMVHRTWISCPNTQPFFKQSIGWIRLPRSDMLSALVFLDSEQN